MSDLSDAWHRVKVPIFGLVGVVMITLIAFAAVKPSALEVERQPWTITGNAVLDTRLFGETFSAKSPCAQVDDPVCGTDEKTYANLCEARKAGVDMLYHSACTWTKE